MIFDMEKETLPREDLEKLQLRRLQDLLARVYATVPFYRSQFDKVDMPPEAVRALTDIQKLPFTTKQDLRDNYPYGLFAVPRENIVRIHASSGTTGKATVVGYTRRDLSNWADCVARCFAMAGITPKDMIHNAYGYGLFTGGLGVHYGSERLGATILPVSGGGTKRQAQILRDFAADVLCCTPSYALHLYEAALKEGIEFSTLPLRVGIFGAEPWSDSMRNDIETKLHIDAVNIYGLSEIMGPGVAMECLAAKHGMHIFEDHFYPEIIDPDTCEVLPDGEVGELVITTITKEGIPLVRYRTRDITALNPTPCKCGRTHRRLQRITGRSDDMLIIRGVNVFPTQIESLLLVEGGLTPYYQLVVDRKNNLDTLEVQVELSENMFSDEIRSLQHQEAEMQKKIKEFLGVTAKVNFVSPMSLPRSEGKAVRVIDKRTFD